MSQTVIMLVIMPGYKIHEIHVDESDINDTFEQLCNSKIIRGPLYECGFPFEKMKLGARVGSSECFVEDNEFGERKMIERKSNEIMNEIIHFCPKHCELRSGTFGPAILYNGDGNVTAKNLSDLLPNKTWVLSSLATASASTSASAIKVTNLIDETTDETKVKEVVQQQQVVVVQESVVVDIEKFAADVFNSDNFIDITKKWMQKRAEARQERTKPKSCKKQKTDL